MVSIPDNSEILLRPEDIAGTIGRLATQIRERHPKNRLHFVGIQTRGVLLSERLRALLESDLGEIPHGTLDISLYRDDLDNLGTIPSLKSTDLPFAVDNAIILLLDDVLFTGRTVKAAIDALTDYGRPRCIELAVLIDRGNRELPISPDYVGLQLQTSRDDYIRVRMQECDGDEGIYLTRRP